MWGGVSGLRDFMVKGCMGMGCSVTGLNKVGFQD